MLTLLIQTAIETPTVMPSPLASITPTPFATLQPANDLISSSDLLSVIGRIDLMISIIGAFSTILLIILGYLLWKNNEAKTKFENEVSAIGDIRKNLESFYSSMYTLIKQFNGILDTYEKSLAEAAKNAKFLKEVAGDVKSIAEKAKAPAPHIQSIAAAQKAIEENYDRLQTFAETASDIRQTMQPSIDAMEKYYSDIVSRISQIPQSAINAKINELNEALEKSTTMPTTSKKNQKSTKKKKKKKIKQS